MNDVALGMTRREVVAVFPHTDPEQPLWCDASKGWEHFGMLPGSLGLMDSTEVRFSQGRVVEVSGSFLDIGGHPVLQENGFRYGERDKPTPAPDPRVEQLLGRLGPPDSKRSADPEIKRIDDRYEVWVYGKLGLQITTHPVYPWDVTLKL